MYITLTEISLSIIGIVLILLFLSITTRLKIDMNENLVKIVYLLAIIVIIYILIKTVYILYKKKVYADEEEIEELLAERDIIDVTRI